MAISRGASAHPRTSSAHAAASSPACRSASSAPRPVIATRSARTTRTAVPPRTAVPTRAPRSGLTTIPTRAALTALCALSSLAFSACAGSAKVHEGTTPAPTTLAAATPAPAPPAPAAPAYAPGAYSGASSGDVAVAPPYMGPSSHGAIDSVPSPSPDRPGLGTTWGEHVNAPISFSPFARASTSPWAEVALHYNDAAGVNAHAAYLRTVPQPLEVYAGDGSLSVALVDESGRTLPGFHANGRALIAGNDGARYRILVRNGTTARFEVVASVDGLDVIDGTPADPNRRGYIIDPHGTLVIDGFRTSDSSVAAFRFGAVADSYAAQTSGDRNVGVIGLALFSERGAVWTPAELHRRDTANPFPSRGYATPPR